MRHRKLRFHKSRMSKCVPVPNPRLPPTTTPLRERGTKKEKRNCTSAKCREVKSGLGEKKQEQLVAEGLGSSNRRPQHCMFHFIFRLL